eukprot:COSAG06_NODE_2167_length_7426_cov_7.331787_1_plen_72_part_00
MAWHGVACRYAAGTGSTEYEKDGELVVMKVRKRISFAMPFYTNIIIYQGRLDANIGKSTQKEINAFSYRAG